MNDLLRSIRTLAWIAFAAALYQELRKPPAERTWHGKVGGFIPYDFRVPTWEKIRSSYWAPESEHVFTDRVVGVGWGVNIPVAIRKLNETVRQYVEVSHGVRDKIARRVPQMTRGRDGDGQPPTGV